MAGNDDITIDDAIANELQLVNFLLRGGNRARAAIASLRAATLCAAAARRAQALTVTRWALDLDPAQFTVRALASSLYAIGNAALPIYRDAAELHLEYGRDEEAYALLQRLVELDSDHPNCRLYLADLHLRRGETDEAIAQLWATLDVFARFGREDGRVEVLRRILLIDDDDVAALAELARAELLRDRPRASLAVVNRLLQLRPADRTGRRLLAEGLARSEKTRASPGPPARLRVVAS